MLQDKCLVQEIFKDGIACLAVPVGSEEKSIGNALHSVLLIHRFSRGHDSCIGGLHTMKFIQ